MLSEIQQTKRFGAAFKNADILLQEVSTATLKMKMNLFEQAKADFIKKNLDPINIFFRNALERSGGSNLIRKVKTPPRPEGVRTRSAAVNDPKKRLRPRAQP